MKIGCVIYHLSLLFEDLITLPVLEQTVQEPRDIVVFFKRRNNAARCWKGDRNNCRQSTDPPHPWQNKHRYQPLPPRLVEAKQGCILSVVHPEWKDMVWRERPDVQVSHDTVEHLVLDANCWKSLQNRH